MSKTGAIYIMVGLNNENNYIHILSVLMNNQWTVNKNGEISFMVNGTFDWQSSPITEFDKVILQVKSSVENKHETAIDLIWKDNITTIGLLFTNENYITITISENIKRTEDNLNVDFSFYLEKLSPIIQNLHSDNIKCVYN